MADVPLPCPAARWVRFWRVGPTGVRYPTMGWLLSDDGAKALIEVGAAGRNTTGQLRTLHLTVPSADVEQP